MGQIETASLDIDKEVLSPFTNLQPSFSAFSSLKDLLIHDAEVQWIPDFVGYIQLERLQLRSLPLFEYIAPEALNGFATSLQSLAITDCAKFTTLTEDIGHCEQLENVTIAQTRFSSAPESLFYLPKLRFLRLYQNALVWLPSYWSLVHLQELDVSFNHLKEIPDAVTTCLQLRVLKASRNYLAALPDAIGRLAALEILDVSHNSIAYLPESFGSLASLASFIAPRNHLKTLPASMDQLSSLQELDLEHNSIEQVPEAITKLYSLTTMKFRGNPMFDHRSDSFGRDILDLQLKRILAARAAEAEAAAAAAAAAETADTSES